MINAFTRPLILALGLPFPAAHIVLGLANLNELSVAWPSMLAMAACLALMVLVTVATVGHTLPRRHCIAMVTGTLAIDVLVQSVLPVGTHPGYAAWHCGAIEMLLVTVAIRNRIGWAWLGIALFAVFDFSASMIHMLSVVDAIAMVLTPVMWIAVATAISIVLRRCDAQIQTYQAQEHASSTKLALEYARRVSQQEWANDLDRAARPLLETVANGGLSEADRTECVLLESELRDQIRGRVLASTEVLQAARAARSRGVRVDIFDDRGAELPPALFAEATAQLASALMRADRGSVKGRALPAEADIAVTILAFDEDSPDDEFYLEIRAPRPT